MPNRRPTAANIANARKRTVPDIIAPNLKVLFVGINPGLYSGATRRHFARPGNRFWPALHRSGFTSRLLSPFESHELLDQGIGVTNIIKRTTASETELESTEFAPGLRQLAAKIRKYRPRAVVFLGVGAYRKAFGLKRAEFGCQKDDFHGAQLWVLPNPSGLNASYQLPVIVRMLREVLRAIRKQPRTSRKTAT